MGTWGAGAFDNDNAMDWVLDLAGATDFSFVEAAFDTVLNPEARFVDAPSAEEALAAAEVVTAAIGAPVADLPPEVRRWITDHGASMDAEILAKAYAALRKVVEGSELRDQWEESDSTEDWREAVVDLQRRIAGAAGADPNTDLFAEEA